jgi:hypothetical protein
VTTAIVTITCPSCGGRVEGVRATSDDQTVKCTFCGTELHIPRVGEVVHERVVREIVHEVESAPVVNVAETNDAGLLRPKRNPLVGLILAGVMVPLLLVFVCVQRQQTQDDMDRFDKQQADEKTARDSCEAGCKAQCANAGDKETGRWTMPPGLDDSQNMEQQMKDTDLLLCTTDCEMKQNCIGLARSNR